MHAYAQLHLKTWGSLLGVPSTDAIGMESIVMFCTNVEVGAALIAICLPTLGPGTFFHNTRWSWLACIGFKLRSHTSASETDYGSQQTSSKSQTCAGHQERDSGEQSETALNGIGYEVDIRVESRDVSPSDTEVKRRYEELFPPGSGKVAAEPKESV